MVFESGRFFPDGNHLLLEAWEAGHAGRLWSLPVAGGTPQPLTPEGVGSHFALSSDGRQLAVRIGASIQIFPVEGGPPRIISGTDNPDRIFAFAADGRSLFLEGETVIPQKLWRLDLATGRRTLWKELLPPEPASVRWTGFAAATPDGRAYAYNVLRWQSDLFVADGLR
jgi:hypothetical protein